MPGPQDVERFEAHMSDSDALMWNIEKDPLLRSTIVTVLFFDRAPDWPTLVARIERGSWLIPRMRQRVATPILRMGPPHWSGDPHFDLMYHLRRVRVCEPTDDAVLDLARTAAMAGFDRSRPLWEYTLVEGLERRPRRDGDEGPPLDDRRRRRHEAAAHALRLRARAGRPGPARRRRGDPDVQRDRPRAQVARTPPAPRASGWRAARSSTTVHGAGRSRADPRASIGARGARSAARSRGSWRRRPPRTRRSCARADARAVARHARRLARRPQARRARPWAVRSTTRSSPASSAAWPRYHEFHGEERRRPPDGDADQPPRGVGRARRQPLHPGAVPRAAHDQGPGRADRRARPRWPGASATSPRSRSPTRSPGSSTSCRPRSRPRCSGRC